MQQLIKITEQNGQQVVSARDLHLFLNVKDNVNTWFKSQVDRAMLEEEVDYTTLVLPKVDGQGGLNKLDYVLTLNSAKEIGMLNGGEKGKEARQYFIACEKIAKQRLLPSYQIENPVERAKKWIEEQEQILLLQKQITKQSAKIEFIDRVLDTDEKIDIGQCAKILELPFGRNTLFKQLREQGIFFKGKNEPKQMYVEKGYFQLKEKWIDRTEGQSFMVLKVLVTQRGLGFLSTIFKSEQKSKLLIKIN